MCTCGNTEPHIIARRSTLDGIGIVCWDNGAIVGRFGTALPGVPVVRPRTDAARAASVVAAHLFMGEVEIYDLSETGALYEACRWAALHGGQPGDVRRRLTKTSAPTLTPVWTVLSTDRDGTPTERYWRLPRLRWPGLAVWDHVNHGRSGRYEIVAIDRRDSDTCMSTGIFFRTQAELFSHLLSESN